MRHRSSDNYPSGRVLSTPVVARFAFEAVIWLVPALLLLPVYLIALAVSVLASDGTLVEFALKIGGPVHAALGPLLVIAAAVSAWYLAMHGETAEDFAVGGMFSAIAAGLGVWLSYRALRRIARGPRKRSRR